MRRLRRGLLLLGVAAPLVLLGLTGYQALKARDALEVVALELDELEEQLVDGDRPEARQSLDEAAEAAQAARINTTGPGWWVASHLPVVGDDVGAVRTVADVADVLTSDVLPALADARWMLDPDRLRPRGGQVAVTTVNDVTPDVMSADRTLRRQAARVAAIDTRNLDARLAGPVTQLQEKLVDAVELSTLASYGVRLLPSMLGVDGPRSYAVIFQNNAEVRATGGIPGAFALLSVNRGAVEMVRQGTTGDIDLDRPVLPLSDEEQALYGHNLALHPQDFNFTPEFPRTGALVKAAVDRAWGTDVDGVVSLDPVALSYVLEATGPVRLPGGVRLTTDNAVPLLLHRAYARFPDPQAQDDFFAVAAHRAFEKLASGAGDPETVLKALLRATQEGRLYVWSGDPREQRIFANTPLAGGIPSGPSQAEPFVGVFLNDGTGAKLQYFLHHRVDVAPTSCDAAGRQEMVVRVTLRSDAPRNGAGLPLYVLGKGAGLGLPAGSMRLNVHLYAPGGGEIVSATVDGRDSALHLVQHRGSEVGSRTVEIAPGQTRELTYRLTTGAEQPGDVALRVTPGVHDTGIGDVRRSAC